MGKIDALTAQVWHCDPLVICGADEEIVYAGPADVEYMPAGTGGELALAHWAGDNRNPACDLVVVTQMERADRVPDVRLGMRSGLSLMGNDAAGQAMTWHIDGAADLFLSRMKAEITPDVHAIGNLAIRRDDTGEILFAGPADVVSELPASVENLACYRLVRPDLAGPVPIIEVTESSKVWPSFRWPRFGDVRRGVDGEGRPVSWHFESAADRLLDNA